MPQMASQVEVAPVTIRLEPAVHLSLDEFFELCQINRDLRLERTAAGELVIVPPTGGASGKPERGADVPAPEMGQGRGQRRRLRFFDGLRAAQRRGALAGRRLGAAGAGSPA